MNRNYDLITKLCLDKRFAISLYSNPVPEIKQWLDLAIKKIYSEDLKAIKKDVEELKKYSLILSSDELLQSIKTKSDEKLHLSETYTLHQKCYFYSEIINYGYFYDLFINLIKNTKLNVNEVLEYLAKNYKSHVYSTYQEILEIDPKILKITDYPDQIKSILIKKENKDKINDIAYKLQIFDFNDAINVITEIIVNSKKKINTTIFENKDLNNKLSKEIIDFYLFLINIQETLYYISNNFSKIYNSLNKIDHINKITQKAVLFNYYLENTNYKDYRLEDVVLFYKKYIFRLDSGCIFENSKDITKTLQIVLKNKKLNQPAIITKKNIQLLLKNKVLTKRKRSLKPKYYRIFFELTNNCNLNCRYCFNRNFERQIELKIRDWEFISNNLPENTELNFFGGEPFLKEGVEKLFLIVDKLLSNKKIRELRCFTNGTNTDKILRILKTMKNPVTLIISLDGLKEQNDFIRGQNNFDKTIKTIKLIKKFTKHKIWVKTLLTRINYDQTIDFVKYLNKLNIDYYSFGELHIVGNAMNKKDEAISYDMAFKLKQKLEELDHNLKLNIKLKDDNIVQDFMINRCGYGHLLVYIRSDGFISGCTENDIYNQHIFELFSDMSKFKNNPINFIPNFYKTGMVDNNSLCYNCNFVNLCMGGCIARAKRYKSKCDIYRKKQCEFLLDTIIKTHNI
ncbi:MAG: radical SAM protein [Acholeplasmataceae bacterium]|nr:radical SAM protein [Acholeplasmataceae bacterium]